MLLAWGKLVCIRVVRILEAAHVENRASVALHILPDIVDTTATTAE
jgi:hypothetical protein